MVTLPIMDRVGSFLSW